MPISVSKEPSQRQLRVAQEIKKIIAGALQRGEVRNPLLLDNIVDDERTTEDFMTTMLGIDLGEAKDF